MSRGVKILIVSLTFLILFLALSALPITDQQRIESKLRDLEYWQRVHFDQSTARDWIGRRFWANMAGKQADAAMETEKRQTELIALGYLVRRSFPLSAAVTNQVDHASFYQALRAASLRDDHWSYHFKSNQLNAVVARDDLRAWEALVNAWDSRRRFDGLETNNPPAPVPPSP